MPCLSSHAHVHHWFQVAHSVMMLIAEGSESTDENIQQYAVDAYAELLNTPNLPDVMLHVSNTITIFRQYLLPSNVQVMAWVLGEYAHISSVSSVDAIAARLCEWVDSHSIGEYTRCWIVQALLKLYAHDVHDSRNSV